MRVGERKSGLGASGVYKMFSEQMTWMRQLFLLSRAVSVILKHMVGELPESINLCQH